MAAWVMRRKNVFLICFLSSVLSASLQAQPVRDVVATQEGDAVAVRFEVVTHGMVTLEVSLDGVNFEPAGAETAVEFGPRILFWRPASGIYTSQLVTRLKWKKSNSIKIGSQLWMAENLNVDKFRNGDPIMEAQDVAAWAAAGKAGMPAWCYYDNELANGAKYGKLYNWYAVWDSRGLCPNGWHVPVDEEWTRLTDHLGGAAVAGIKMKAKSGWENYEGRSGNGKNESGFSAFPSGHRSKDGYFNSIGKYAFWWSATALSSNGAWDRSVEQVLENVFRSSGNKEAGYSVRCLKD